ncbi:uncharacterized protein [Montipora capricornis]|uniref:uncharacterized protein n=1 Tax=Montipora foliosa TaxID=591990 RepID=UPI0035F158C1
MDAILAEGKTRKQQSNEQALRRLKYLHTSLFPTHKEKTFHGGKKVKETLWTQGLPRTECEEVFTTCTPRGNPEKRYFMSLQPKTVRKHNNERDSGQIPKYNYKQKRICMGRAPLQAYTYYSRISVSNSEERFDLKPCYESRSPLEQMRSSAKSAPEVIRSMNTHKCNRCFVNDFGYAHRKQATKNYYTNIRINRVTFSARPRGSSGKSLGRESRKEIPKGRVLNGWCARLQKEPSNIYHSDLKWHANDATDVTASLQTLKLETRKDNLQRRYGDQKTPHPTPTPVRQIDVTLPQGMVLKYHLSEDE